MNTNKRKFIVGIYARISKDTLDSTNQLILLRNYCKSMDYDIYSEYVDVISGASSNKPEFCRMMQDASKRRIDMVLFFALDRFTREGTRKTIHYLQQLDDYGVMYKSYSEQYIDSSGIFRDVIIALLSTLAQQERLRISERVKAGLEKSRTQGRIGGRPSLELITVRRIKDLKNAGNSIVYIAKELKISRGSVYQYL